MRAMQLIAPRSLLRETDVLVPEPGAEQVLFRVHACFLQKTDFCARFFRFRAINETLHGTFKLVEKCCSSPKVLILVFLEKGLASCLPV